MTTKELLESAYIMKNWDIRMTPEEITNLVNDARNYAEKFDENTK
jgi:hypothetical protein